LEMEQIFIGCQTDIKLKNQNMEVEQLQLNIAYPQIGKTKGILVHAQRRMKFSVKVWKLGIGRDASD